MLKKFWYAVSSSFLFILCALFLIVALAKFLKGEPGSEVVFLRIGVALLGGVAFLTILTKAFGF